MSDFQSMREEYRLTDVLASGFPIRAKITLPGMARPVQRSEFGQRLYDARKKAKLTQKQLAEKAGVVQSTLAELEKSGQGSSKTLQLAAACFVRPEWLATGEHKEPEGWPFSDELQRAVAALEPPQVAELENAIRMYLGLPRISQAAPARDIIDDIPANYSTAQHHHKGTGQRHR